MQSDSGKTVSVWMDTIKMPTFAPLEEDLSCDVCIVGAGIVGLTTAYHLVRAGADVVILDDGEVCGGETSRTTAHLSCVLDDRFQWLERVHGEKRVRESTSSHMAAINRIEAIVREEKIECDFARVPGYLLLGKSDAPDFLDRELEGFGELFRMLSYEQVGAAAMLSRALGGVSRGKAVFALPGSRRAVELGMEKLVVPELRHVVFEVRKLP